MSKKAKIIATTLGVTGGVLVGVAAGVGIMFKRSMKRIKGHEAEHNAMEIVSLGRHDTTLAPDTDNAYLSCLLGRSKIFAPDVLEKDLYIDLCNVLGKTIVVVPTAANVKCDLELVRGTLSEEIVDVADGAPTVHIVGKSVLGKVEIQRV